MFLIMQRSPRQLRPNFSPDSYVLLLEQIRSRLRFMECVSVGQDQVQGNPTLNNTENRPSDSLIKIGTEDFIAYALKTVDAWYKNAKDLVA
jgi:hypothetical protein